MKSMVHVFDASLQNSNLWIKDIMGELRTNDAYEALKTLRVILQALREIIPYQEVRNISAHLPLDITGILYEDFEFRERPEKMDGQQFLKTIGERLGAVGIENPDPLRYLNAVFQALIRRLPRAEVETVEMSLPGELKDLFKKLGSGSFLGG